MLALKPRALLRALAAAALPLLLAPLLWRRALPPAPPRVRAGATALYKQPNVLGSLGEAVLVHAPLCFTPAGALVSLRRHSFGCSDFSRARAMRGAQCEEYLRVQGASRAAVHDPALAYANLVRVAAVRGAVRDASVVVVSLHPRDVNVCHVTMRLMLAWGAVRRAGTAYGPPGMPPVEAVVMLMPPIHRAGLARRFSGEWFHAKLTKALFEAQGVPVYRLRGVAQFARKRTVCYSAGMIVGSHANKFAFPDADLPGEGQMPFPKSSDAYAARAAVYKDAGGLPAMKRQITYIARKVHGRRAFTEESEREFRAILRAVADETGSELLVFGVAEKEPTFEEQIAYVKSAAMIVGLHGAGLTLGLFAPEHCALVEVFPAGSRVNLFRNLEMSGLNHTNIVLDPWEVQQRNNITLTKRDLAKVQSVLLDKMREVSASIVS